MTNARRRQPPGAVIVAVGVIEFLGRDRRQLSLAPQAEAASLAGALVADACHAWDLIRLLHPARLVMSELVLNAVEHAGTNLVVTVERRGAALYLAVSDGTARLPRLREPGPPRGGVFLDDRGRGLRTVQATASVWGATPTATGKVVWAVLRVDAGRAARSFLHDSRPATLPGCPDPRSPHRPCRRTGRAVIRWGAKLFG